MRKLYAGILALLAVVLHLNPAIAQSGEHSFGLAPEQAASKSEVILPNAANPASRAFVYTGGGPFQLSKHSLANTTLTAIGAAVPFVFPGAAAWRTTTNQLYVIDQGAPFALYTVDTVTGARTFIANCTGVPHANFTGMTWDRTTNTMYGVSSSLSASQIFTINLTTGACTPVGGPTAVSPGCIMINAAPGGSLFGVDLVNDQLFRWNKTTGVPTSIGPLGFNANFGQDGHFDLSDGQYYYAAYNATAGQPQLRILDTLNGSSVLVAPYGVVQTQTLGIYTPLNPPNDDCVNSILMTCNTSASGNTATATLDGPPTSCTGGSVAPDVWYRIVGSGAPITARTCGSIGSYDTKLDIYSGTCGALVSVACNDDFCGLLSQVTWAGTAGVTYYIRVHGFAGATGSFTLTVSCPPPNDACSAAININCGQTIAGNNINATADAVPVCITIPNPGVWYRFTGSGGIETLSTCAGGSFDTRIFVYSGSCAGLVCVGFNDDFCGGSGLLSQVTYATVAGTTYFVLVDGFASQTGSFLLTRTCPPCVGVPSPGAITGSSGPYCPGASVTLTLAGNTIANGITYQWRSSLTPGGPYTAIPGATSVSYTFNTTTTTYFIVSVTCTNPGGGTGNTVEFPVNVSNLVHSNVLATPNVACSPGATVITGTVSGTATVAGNYTHTLTGPGAIGAPVVSGARNSNVSFSVTIIPAGVHTYVLTSTDPLGCTVVTNVTMTVNQTPIITLTTTPGPTPPAPPGTNYVFSTSTGNVLVPGTVLVAGSQGDDVTAPIALPFPYSVYGVTYNSARVGSNGNIQFTGGGNGDFSNTCPLPTGDFNAQGGVVFMPMWDDLWTATSTNPANGIFTSVSGVAPNRIFNIEWRAQYFPGTGSVSFAVRLFEGQERVDFIYGGITGTPGSSASVGVQGGPTPTTLFTQYSCNTASLGSGLGISFVLPAPVVICNGNIVRIDAQAVPPAQQTFNTGATNIHIPAGGTTSGIASPYPGAIPVSGLITSGVTVKSVTLTSYSHDLPDDVDIVLVSPTGQSVILMSDAGGNIAATGQTFTFDDAAATTLLDAAFNPSGTYRPTNFGAGDNWPAPGPLGAPVSTTLSTFTGNPNGNWSLYVVDDNTGSVGFISDWRITFNVPQRVVFSPLTNLFTDAAATIAYTGTPEYTVWARPSVNTTYTASSTITGCSSTKSVSIVVNQLPAITTQPVALAAPICPGFNVVYSVGATGTGLTYQWQVSSTGAGGPWTNITDPIQYAGFTTNTLTIINVSTALNGYQYRCVVSGTCPPPVTSNAVILVVSTAPVITTQPANRIVCAPDAASFTAAASGIPAPTIYQWQVSVAAGPFNNVVDGVTAGASGAYTPTLTINPTTTAMSGNQYRLVVTNSCGQSVTSNAATLTVNARTPVTIAPLPTRICLSDTLINLSATPVGGSWSGVGVSGFNFVPSATAVGTYTLTYTYTNAAGCTSTGTVIAPVIDCPERIRLLSKDGVILFPNPNGGRFNIRMNSVLYNFLGMRVFNTAGQLLMTQTFSGLVYGRVVPIDLSHLPAGAYMVKFLYDDGIRTSEKTFPVIIQRN